MKKNNKKKYIIAGALVLVVGIAGMAVSGNLFQGKFFFRMSYCDINQKGTSDVASWVPTQSSTFTPPSNEATEVISKVPCPKLYGEMREMHQYVPELDKVGPPIDVKNVNIKRNMPIMRR